ncbi:hypothetical protein RJ639_039410 [Escallonia herrerae]|uniref:RRM domain-containing protein n=1 Tax=Escallonia herrerae TaxID=1293975 RepID=A0AA89B697_9ASTE|nr:hypothetical protein RJ639_039410 [Escallonia herrerae]
MDAGSPENGSEEMNNSSAGESGLWFVPNEENVKENVHDDFRTSNEFHEYMDDEGEQELPSLPSDLRYHEISRSPSENCRSPLQAGFGNGGYLNEQRLSGEYHYQEKTEELHGSSFQAEAEASNHETEVSALQESCLVGEANEEDKMGDSSPAKEVVIDDSVYELPKSFTHKEVEDEVTNLQTEQLHSSPRFDKAGDETKSKKLEMLGPDQHSLESIRQLSKAPATLRETSISPDRSPGASQYPGRQKESLSQQGLQNLSYSPKSLRKKHNSSSERSDLGSKDRALRSSRQKHASLKGSRHESQYVNISSEEHALASPREHESHQRHRRRDRSVPRSPIRLRDPSPRHRRHRCSRSRSRSPYKSNYSRDSQRRRYSPRHRSPPLSYHSYRRSPKRRPWSPPRNRSTGVGKPGRDLFVAGFSFLTTERDLERKFSRFGRVRDVRIVRDKRDDEADAAIRALDKTEWNGRIVLVEKSKSH